MIAYLEGRVQSKNTDTIIINVNGVGYGVTTPAPLLQKLEVGAQTTLHIYTHVTESSLQLFGLETPSDREFFNILISINGVGPKMAIAILSFPADRIASALLSEDVATLTEIPGVGKKLAERMILELRSKIPAIEGQVGAASGASQSSQEAMEALQTLGFSKSDAIQMLQGVPEGSDTEAAIKYALSQKE